MNQISASLVEIVSKCFWDLLKIRKGHFSNQWSQLRGIQIKLHVTKGVLGPPSSLGTVKANVSKRMTFSKVHTSGSCTDKGDDINLGH